MTREQQAMLEHKIKIFDEHKAYAINNPDGYKKMLDGLGSEFSQYFPTPEKFAAMSPAQRQDELFKKEKIVSTLRNVLTPFQQIRAEQEERKIGIQEKKAGADIDFKREGLQIRAAGMEKQGGAWATSPDGKKRLYFTPGNPPPADWNWDKPGKEDDDTETITRPLDLNHPRRGGTITTKEKKKKVTVTGVTQPKAASGEGPTPTAQEVPPGTRRQAADGTYWRNDNGVITQEQ